jgi:hypothetical protein
MDWCNTPTMSSSERPRSGSFWDALEGKAPIPPAAVLLGWQLLSVSPERGEIEVLFEGGDQGGFLAAMLDDAGAPPVRSDPRGSKSASCGRPSRAAWSERDKSSIAATIAFLAGDLFDGDGEQVASATATARIVRLP